MWHGSKMGFSAFIDPDCYSVSVHSLLASTVHSTSFYLLTWSCMCQKKLIRLWLVVGRNFFFILLWHLMIDLHSSFLFRWRSVCVCVCVYGEQVISVWLNASVALVYFVIVNVLNNCRAVSFCDKGYLIHYYGYVCYYH